MSIMDLDRIELMHEWNKNTFSAEKKNSRRGKWRKWRKSGNGNGNGSFWTVAVVAVLHP